MSLKESVLEISRATGFTCDSAVIEALGPAGVFHWRCSKGHTFRASVMKLRHSAVCPQCMTAARVEPPAPAKAVWTSVPIAVAVGVPQPKVCARRPRTQRPSPGVIR